MILSQRKEGLDVDPDLLAGRPPAWAIHTFQLVVALSVLPFLIWLLAHTLPRQLVFEVGRFLNEVLWADVPPTALKHCGLKCPDLVFGMAVLPAVWFAGFVGAFIWYGLSKQRLAYQEDRLRKQSLATTVTSTTDRLAKVVGRRPWVAAIFVLSLVFLLWFLPKLVGQMRYHLDGRTEVFTDWRFGIPCAILALGMAVTGFYFLVLQRLARLNRKTK